MAEFTKEEVTVALSKAAVCTKEEKVAALFACRKEKDFIEKMSPETEEFIKTFLLGVRGTPQNDDDWKKSARNFDAKPLAGYLLKVVLAISLTPRGVSHSERETQAHLCRQLSPAQVTIFGLLVRAKAYLTTQRDNAEAAAKRKETAASRPAPSAQKQYEASKLPSSRGFPSEWDVCIYCGHDSVNTDDSISHLEQRAEEEEHEHSTNVSTWNRGDKTSKCPRLIGKPVALVCTCQSRNCHFQSDGGNCSLCISKPARAMTRSGDEQVCDCVVCNCHCSSVYNSTQRTKILSQRKEQETLTFENSRIIDLCPSTQNQANYKQRETPSTRQKVVGLIYLSLKNCKCRNSKHKKKHHNSAAMVKLLIRQGE